MRGGWRWWRWRSVVVVGWRFERRQPTPFAFTHTPPPHRVYMTNGRGAGMASFMTKKKKYKFQVEVILDELLEVPFVSAVLFAKLRLLDGGNFQDYSRRVEVKDHTVIWGSRYSFPCKMLANASTGILERCVLRISVRKECKGGRAFTKLGFVDLNLAEFAGAGLTSKKALLEGYDARHRQDNSMLNISIRMNMLSGDILFKVPSPSSKHKPVPKEETVVTEARVLDEYSGGSLAGSIASGSSGFGSLPKKRTPLLSSELLIGHTLPESNVPVTIALDGHEILQAASHEPEEFPCEPGHSRNSSNTSQMSKASGYSSVHSHSRQSSSGDSGHIRDQHKSKRGTTVTIPSTFPEDNINNNLLKESSQTPDEMYGTPRGSLTPILVGENNYLNCSNMLYHTPKGGGCVDNNNSDVFRTPDTTFTKPVGDGLTVVDARVQRSSDCSSNRSALFSVFNNYGRKSFETTYNNSGFNEGVLRSKSDFEIPRNHVQLNNNNKQEGIFHSIAQRSDSLFAFLTPLTRRRVQTVRESWNHSTPSRNQGLTSSFNKLSPIQKSSSAGSNSLGSLKTATADHLGVQPIPRGGLPHRKLLDGGTGGGKLATVANSPDESTATVLSSSNDCSQIPAMRRPSVTQNPSSGSLVLSETGSLDRAKAVLERRKKNQPQEQELAPVSGRVEGTRVNPDHLIDEIIKNTNLDQADESAESSGLQLFIAKDGTAALGSHEVKSQISTGVFKQVVMEDNR